MKMCMWRTMFVRLLVKWQLKYSPKFLFFHQGGFHQLYLVMSTFFWLTNQHFDIDLLFTSALQVKQDIFLIVMNVMNVWFPFSPTIKYAIGLRFLCLDD